MRAHRGRALVGALALAAGIACDDPARPVPDVGGGTLFIDSDPAGGRVLIDGVDTEEVTPILLQDVGEGERLITVELDSAGFVYSGVVTLDVKIGRAHV